MEPGFVRRLAVLCKDYYVNRTIDDLFAFAGAESSWHQAPLEPTGSLRMDNFYGWVNGIQRHAPGNLDAILNKVATDISRNEAVPAHERKAIESTLASLMRDDYDDTIQLGTLLPTLARLLANDGLSREVAVLISAEPRLELINIDTFSGDDLYALLLPIPVRLYAQMENEIKDCETAIHNRIWKLVGHIEGERIIRVTIHAKLVSDNTWRDKAIAWLTGEKVNNQGRVRSDNVAPRTEDGLQFRSEQEINLYKALKSRGISFAPLPVFVRGGKEYRRIEPDFVILKDGVCLVVEVDGDTFHRETPAEAYNRTTMLEQEGARIVRVNASECETPEKAAICATKIIQIIAKIKDAGR